VIDYKDERDQPRSDDAKQECADYHKHGCPLLSEPCHQVTASETASIDLKADRPKATHLYHSHTKRYLPPLFHPVSTILDGGLEERLD
jgi:hypothetical protein